MPCILEVIWYNILILKDERKMKKNRSENQANQNMGGGGSKFDFSPML